MYNYDTIAVESIGINDDFIYFTSITSIINTCIALNISSQYVYQKGCQGIKCKSKQTQII